MSGEYWNRVLRHYRELEEEFIGKKANVWAFDVYAWHDVVQMSPIEDALWFDIRAEGAVLYPQYPVAGYFVDFGNPIAKVAIECDGKEFHKDLKRDEQRQRRIEAAGWTVYRLSGSACVKADEYSDDEDGHAVITLSPARLLVREIAKRHGLR